MKLSYSLFKDILQAVEDERLRGFMESLGNNTQWQNGLDSDELKQVTEKRERLYYKHLQILIDSKLVEGVKVNFGVDNHISVGYSDPYITIKGMDFFNALKSSKVFDALKRKSLDLGCDLSFNFILDNARTVINSLIG